MRFRRLLILSLLAVTLVLAVGLAAMHPAKASPQGAVAAPHPSVADPAVCASVSCQIAQANHERLARTTTKRTTYVYITKTGSKYHRNGCRYLAHSKIKKTLKWAKKHGYKPCKVCKPPK